LQQQSAPHWAICPNCDFVFYNNPAPCVSLLFYQDGQVLLARRGIEPQKGKWDLVGGFINTGESGEAAAVREAKEETGLKTKIKQYLGSVADIYGDTLVPTLNLVYWLEIISGAIKAQDDVAELKWFDLKQVLKDLAFHNVRVAIDLLKAEIHYNEV